MLILWQNNPIWSWNIIQNIDVEWFKIWNLSLNSESFQVKNFNIQEQVENNKYVNPFYDWYSPISYYLRGGKITFDLTIRWATKYALMENIDLLRNELFEENQTLYVEINGVKRKVIVNCVWNPLNFNNYNITFLKTSISLEYNDFFLNLTSNNVVFTNKTSDFIANLDNDWTQRSELEIIYVFGAGTNLTAIEIIDWDNTFTITENLIEGDVLKINWKTKKVTKNWQIIDFDWELLWLENEWSRFDFKFIWNVKCDVFILNDIKYR